MALLMLASPGQATHSISRRSRAPDTDLAFKCLCVDLRSPVQKQITKIGLLHALLQVGILAHTVRGFSSGIQKLAGNWPVLGKLG